MRKFAAAAIILGIALLAGCGGGDTHASLVDEANAMMVEVGTILDSVKDEASADAAAAKIDALAVRAQDLSKRQKALPKLEKEEAEALKAKMVDAGKNQGELQAKAMKAAPYIAQSKKLQDAFEKFGKAMN